MKALKIAGWTVLVIGLAAILYGLYASFNIFTGKSSAPVIFEVQPKHPLATEEKMPETSLSPSQLVEDKLQEAIRAMIPLDFISKALNLISWSVFALILIFGGAQVSNLGIKMIRS